MCARPMPVLCRDTYGMVLLLFLTVIGSAHTLITEDDVSLLSQQIDQQVTRRLDELKIVPAGISNDAEFVGLAALTFDSHLTRQRGSVY